MKGEEKHIIIEFSHQHLDMYSHMLMEDLLFLIYLHLLSWFPIAPMKLSEKFILSKLLGKYIKNGFTV